MKRFASFALGGLLALGACGLDVPDLNNPSLSTLQDSPTAVLVEGATTGMFIGNRGNVAAENGYVLQLGVLGREAYNFDGADPRYVSELLAGTLSSGSPFGGNFWAGPYANIRLANVILTALGKLSTGELDDGSKAGIRAVVNTIQAMDLLTVINTHDTNGAVIDADVTIVLPPARQPLGAIVDKATTFARIVSLLDDAAKDLANPDVMFPFALSPGYAGFDAPETFLKFNRAIRARVALYLKDYDGALAALADSFLDDDETVTPTAPIDLNNGVFQVYSTKTGDTTNALINRNIYAHPSLETDAEKNAAGEVDARFTAKITRAAKVRMVGPLKSQLQFGGLYNSPESSVPVIRNEELILIKAEALFYKGNVADAITELNIVRTKSGGLEPLTGTPTEASFLDELLYERRYSLLFEGGHRWIDLRRLGRTDDLVLDDPGYGRNLRYPIPLPECNARPNEPACALGSQ